MPKKTAKKKTVRKAPKKKPARPDVNERAKGLLDTIIERTNG